MSARLLLFAATDRGEQRRAKGVAIAANVGYFS